MGGAVLINLILFKLILAKKTLLAPEHDLPSKIHIDKGLVLGTALFGIGWGLVGICPGPGIVNLVSLNNNAIVFIMSLVFGMLLFKKQRKD